MSRKLNRPLVAAAIFAGVVACTVSLSFDYNKTGVAVQFSGTQMNQAIPIDLSTQPDVQAHKGNVQSISLEYADATVSAVGTGNTVTAITGTMTLVDDTVGAAPVTVGTLTNVPVTVGSKVHLTGSAALDALALKIIKGSGKGTATIAGTAAGGTVANFTLDLKFHMSMEYSP